MSGKVVLSNGFSINMLGPKAMDWAGKGDGVPLYVKKIGQAGLAETMASVTENAIGHADLAAIVAGMFPALPPASRKSVAFDMSDGGWDTLIVAQYLGPRLPEGTTILPEGARVECFALTFIPGQHFAY